MKGSGMMVDKYILKGKKVVICSNLMTWAKWVEDKKNTRVGLTKKKEVVVSTIFLPCPYISGHCFETRVFNGKHGGESQSYKTYDGATAGHKAMCRRVFGDGT